MKYYTSTSNKIVPYSVTVLGQFSIDSKSQAS